MLSRVALCASLNEHEIRYTNNTRTYYEVPQGWLLQCVLLCLDAMSVRKPEEMDEHGKDAAGHRVGACNLE